MCQGICVRIKHMHGAEMTLEVPQGAKISEMKVKIYQYLGVLPENQKLVLLGETLADEKFTAEYPEFKDGSEIHLVVVEKATPVSEPALQRDALKSFLKRYYPEAQAEMYVQDILDRISSNVFSLNDVRRWLGGNGR